MKLNADRRWRLKDCQGFPPLSNYKFTNNSSFLKSLHLSNHLLNSPIWNLSSASDSDLTEAEWTASQQFLGWAPKSGSKADRAGPVQKSLDGYVSRAWTWFGMFGIRRLLSSETHFCWSPLMCSCQLLFLELCPGKCGWHCSQFMRDQLCRKSLCLSTALFFSETTIVGKYLSSFSFSTYFPSISTAGRLLSFLLYCTLSGNDEWTTVKANLDSQKLG